MTGKALGLDGVGQAEAVTCQTSGDQGLAPFAPQALPALWLVCWSSRRENGQLLVVRRLPLGGSLPSLPSLVCRAGPIASPLEPLFLALQPAGPLEEGLSLFFNKLLTISPS